MHRSSPFSLSRLRSNRGLWLVCVLTMLFKLTTGALCLADGPHAPPDHATPTDVAASLDAGDGDGDCVLGEAGGCHCLCSHSVPVPRRSLSSHRSTPLPRTGPCFLLHARQPTLARYFAHRSPEIRIAVRRPCEVVVVCVRYSGDSYAFAVLSAHLRRQCFSHCGGHASQSRSGLANRPLHTGVSMIRSGSPTLRAP